jgi:hypothetical protein
MTNSVFEIIEGGFETVSFGVFTTAEKAQAYCDLRLQHDAAFRIAYDNIDIVEVPLDVEYRIPEPVSYRHPGPRPVFHSVLDMD